jgi:hypothetical protein
MPSKANNNKANDTIEPESNDLVRLRDMLYGNQVRESDTRMGELEKRIESVRATLQEDLTSRFDSLSQSSSNGISDLRTQINEQLDQRFNDSSNALRATRRDITEQVEKLEQTQNTQISSLRREINSSIDAMKRELLSQMQQDRRELANRLDQISSEQANRILSVDTEGRLRDDVLRQELLTLSGYLDDKKTSRNDLAQLLVDMGESLKALGQGSGNAKEDAEKGVEEVEVS